MVTRPLHRPGDDASQIVLAHIHIGGLSLPGRRLKDMHPHRLLNKTRQSPILQSVTPIATA